MAYTHNAKEGRDAHMLPYAYVNEFVTCGHDGILTTEKDTRIIYCNSLLSFYRLLSLFNSNQSSITARNMFYALNDHG